MRGARRHAIACGEGFDGRQMISRSEGPTGDRGTQVGRDALVGVSRPRSVDGWPIADTADLIEVHREGRHVLVECARRALVGFRYPRGVSAQRCRATSAVTESACDRADVHAAEINSVAE
jgi:hypothetical protein